MTYIGEYRVIKKIGKGGMGEIFLVKDPQFDRFLALKKIRGELCQKQSIKKRFLREAGIAARLVHPGVISVYSIHDVDKDVYYTMPYLVGQSLKNILKSVWKKKNLSPELREKTSVSSLISIFYNICQTMEYVHSKNILHRDLKPDNIFIGRFGEVVILDWGVALDAFEEESIGNDDASFENIKENVTVPGKLVGTLDYMAPERLQGLPATKQTDIYALGIMLYQFLTLNFPFPRRDKGSIKKKIASEVFIAPEEVAPFRDIPPLLSKVVSKCIATELTERYASVTDLLKDLSLHIGGNPEWFLKEKLSFVNKTHWLFQENILLSNHVPLMETVNLTEWFCIMVTKTIFSEDLALEVTLKFSKITKGMGFLFSPPKEHQQEKLLDGYCLWMSVNSDNELVFKLFKNAIEIIGSYGLSLDTNQYHSIRIEKRHNKLSLCVDGISVLTYVDYLPEGGSHIGILFKDIEFFNNEFSVYESSRSLYVSCLSIPDAFLANKNYEKAFSFYKQIVSSFPGRVESREAQFRAGLTLLEKAKKLSGSTAENLYSLAFEEFSLLHNTSGAPLEYLGKSLIYQSQEDFTEEIKCLELGVRRYREHSLSECLKERILYRMYETVYYNKEISFSLMLMVLRLLPEETRAQNFQRFCTHVCRRDLFLKMLGFVPDFDNLGHRMLENYKVSIFLGFNLASLRILSEIFELLIQDIPLHIDFVREIIFSVYKLGVFPEGRKRLMKLRDVVSFCTVKKKELKKSVGYLEIVDNLVFGNFEDSLSAFLCFQGDLESKLRLFVFIAEFLLETNQEELLIGLIDDFSSEVSIDQYTSYLKPQKIWALLQLQKYSTAHNLLFEYSVHELIEDSSLIFTLFGCWLAATEGQELALIHFSGISNQLTIPSYVLIAYVLAAEVPFSVEKLFLWEKRILYRQLILFYSCLGDKQQESHYRNVLREEKTKFLSSCNL